jgi:NodT family efflux transporter outer membrane factor (OMF) lipoprotein
MKKALTGLLGLLLLGTPTLAAKENTPPQTVNLSAVWQELDNFEGYTPVFPSARWWEAFQDPYLTRYIEQALANNPSLSIAAQRVKEAQALARQELADELPSASVAVDYNRQKNSANLLAPNLAQRTAAASQQPITAGAGAVPIFAPGQVFSFYQLPLRASYELDYLLRNRDETRAANQATLVAEQDRRTAWVTLTTDVATAYFNLLRADQLVSVQQQIVDRLTTDLALACQLYEAGLSPRSEVITAQNALLQAQNELPELQRNQSVFARQIAVLMGNSVNTPIQRGTLAALNAMGDKVPVGLPAELLQRRPDIQAAQAELSRQKILTRVARKNFFPTLTLNGSYGFGATQFEDWMKGDSRFWSYGGEALYNLFQGGRRVAQLRAQKSRYDTQFARYRETVLNAFQEVENSLALIKSNANQLQFQRQQLALQQEALGLVQQQYSSGLISRRELLTAERSVLQTEFTLNDLRGTHQVNTLGLIRALGGGF